MRRLSWIFAVTLSLIFLASCSSQKNIVAEFGDYDITYDELENAYYKNLSEEEKKSANAEEGLKDFLELYVNYKMKLRDAEVRGFAQDPELQKEIDDYTKTVGVPYVEEKFIVEPGLKKLYDRRKVEKRVSHILLRTSGNNADSVMQLAQELITRLKGGESFEALAKEYSQDEFSKNEGGDIYWLTAGQTVPEFDDAMYNTDKGEIYPEPIKTRFGIHILQVTDEQPRIYQVKAQHILVAFKQEEQIDTSAALEKAKQIKAKLDEGASFEELAKEYSDDPGSKNNGGDLGYFQRRMMVKPFDEVAFSLQPGEVSDVIETRFGFHIIKVNDRKEMPSFEEEKDKIKQLYQSKQYPVDRVAFIESLKKEYSFQKNEEVYKQLRDRSGYLTFTDEFWDSDQDKEIGDSALVFISGNSYTTNDFMNYALNESKYANNRMTNGAVESAVDEYVAKQLIIRKALELNAGNTEFAKLMDDYRNGLYIFKLQEEEIWNKIKVDTTQLTQLFEETSGQYTWPDRAAFDVIYRADSTDIFNDKAQLASGIAFDSIIESNKKTIKLANKNGPRSLKIIDGDELAEKAFNLAEVEDISEPFKSNDGWYIVKLTEKIPSRAKTFEEAESELIGVWQEQQTKKLEDEYIKQLRKIYGPELYYDRLSELQTK